MANIFHYVCCMSLAELRHNNYEINACREHGEALLQQSSMLDSLSRCVRKWNLEVREYIRRRLSETGTVAEEQ